MELHAVLEERRLRLSLLLEFRMPVHVVHGRLLADARKMRELLLRVLDVRLPLDFEEAVIRGFEVFDGLLGNVV